MANRFFFLALIFVIPCMGADLPRLSSEFETTLHSEMKRFHIPGLAVGIVSDKGLVYAKGFGFRDVARKLPVTLHTRFMFGSIAKCMTAATAAMLVDDKKLTFDKPLRNYLPDFEMADPIATAQASLRDLLLHRTGLPDHFWAWYGSPLSRRELFERQKFLEPSAAFRSKRQYSNLSFVTVGYIIERISGTGETWETFTRRRLLNPLWMSETEFKAPDKKRAGDYSVPYRWDQSNFIEIPYRVEPAHVPSGGEINASMADLAKWLRFQWSDGRVTGKTMIVRDTFEELHRPQLEVPGKMGTENPFERSPVSYALDWGNLKYRGKNLVRRRGSVDGYNAALMYFPDKKLGVVLLQNISHWDFLDAVGATILDELLHSKDKNWYTLAQGKFGVIHKKTPALSPTKPPFPLENYAGRFVHRAYGVLTVTVVKDHLKIGMHATETVGDVYHRSQNVFVLANEEEPVPKTFQFEFKPSATRPFRITTNLAVEEEILDPRPVIFDHQI